MGLLDDAIREHLDLKRRRGGDPAEIARSEQEALGPVRREPAPAQVADEHHDEHEHRHEHRHDETPVAEPLHAPAHEQLHHEYHAREHEHHQHERHVHEHHEHHEHFEHDHPPEDDDATQAHDFGPPAHESHPEPAAAPAPDPRHSDVVYQPTTEFHVEHHDDEDEDDRPSARPPAADPAGEDVLEETPDFLQETPEHDRLWFEQRPPRDFDFDG